jgi:hypothetical protein
MKVRSYEGDRAADTFGRLSVCGMSARSSRGRRRPDALGILVEELLVDLGDVELLHRAPGEILLQAAAVEDTELVEGTLAKSRAWAASVMNTLTIEPSRSHASSTRIALQAG